ncbi:MAG: chemotaxis protein CheA [Myxococcota bacterium]
MSLGGRGHDDFVAEATEILDHLGRDLFELDERRGKQVDPDLVNGIFRAAHSLKGLAGMFGHDHIAHLAHRTEDLLDRLRLGKLQLSGEVVDALIDALDVLQALVAEAVGGKRSEASGGKASALAQRLETMGTLPLPTADDPLDRLALDPRVRAVFTEYEEHRLRENVKRGVAVWKVRAAFDLSDFDQRLARLNAALKPLGEVISTLPSSEPGDASSIAFDLIFGSAKNAKEIASALQGLPAAVIPLEAKPEGRKKRRARIEAAPAVAVLPAPLEPPSRAEAESSLRSLTQTVRVDIGRLDALMNSVGELLLIKANVQRLAEAARSGGALAVSKLWGQELYRESRLLERKLDELQKGILEVRMVPLGHVFDKLARLVRRVAREMGKEIDFAIAGGEVELDKLIVEDLSDPLMHLIRNAIDHGIETPQARAEKGKPRRGTVALRAAQRGNHVVIEVSDDGAGLDEERIREVAISRSLLTREQAHQLGRRDLFHLVFLPGFSTARSVSELSGRGVGLDVVKTNLAQMSGLIDVTSQAGQGTTFTLTLPVTLAIIRALVVSASERTYAVPLNSVLEIIAVEDAQIRTVERREVVSLRGQTLPFTRLCRLFRLPEQPRARHYVVVVGLAQERLGLAVDELVGQQDVVVKPLPGRLRHLAGIAGATDLGNRKTVLVLDVAGLMEKQGMAQGKALG